MSTEPLATITLPIELTNGNDGRGSRWFRSANVRKQIENTLRAMGLVSDPFDFPVFVHVTRLIPNGGREWDWSSVGRGNWKEIEDAMVACGWFHDDGPKWMKPGQFFQRKSPDGKPSVEVKIFKAEN